MRVSYVETKGKGRRQGRVVVLNAKGEELWLTISNYASIHATAKLDVEGAEELLEAIRGFLEGVENDRVFTYASSG